MQVECCICRDWRNHENPKVWFTPNTKRRREHHFSPQHRFSHTYCPHCFILQLRANGTTVKEVVRIMKERE